LKKSNYKIVESVYNTNTNNNNNYNNNHIDYNNSNNINSYVKNKINNSSSNAEIYVRNISLDKNKEKNENDNPKNLIINHKLDYSNSNSKSKNKDKKHHRFYESNGSKNNVLNNISNKSYHSYNCNNDYNNDRQLKCLCGYFLEREDSIKRNIIYNNNKYEKDNNNLKSLGENYLNNEMNEPCKRQNTSGKKFIYQNQTFNPNKTRDLSNTLFSSFILSKNNGKLIFGRSQSHLKNNNSNLKRRINSQDYRKFNNDNNCKSQIKVVNINLTEIKTANYTNNNNSNNKMVNSNISQRNSKRKNLNISN
jgi:hypothetical protein